MTEPAPTSNADQVAYWNDRAAQTWTALQHRIDATFRPITAAAIAAARPAPGEHVIDVGCGCGDTVLEIAHAVAPAGSVFGIDVSQPMLARARERVAAENLAPENLAPGKLAKVELQIADAATHPFGPNRFDLLFSRFGVMFFADPTATFAHLRTAMRPQGRLLFAAWRPMAENPWFLVPLEAARPVLPPQPPTDPTAPGPFAFADPDRVKSILTAAGWNNVQATRHDTTLQISQPGHPEEATDYLTRLGALARLLAEADEQTRIQAKAAVAEAIKPHDGPNGVTLGASIWLVSANA